ncbi:MAG: hypothetical protein IPG08_03715 [Sphingobacteriaceae bacterium]|nr:hypothetical protein [Sphingobacteriaceae bacterium]
MTDKRTLKGIDTIKDSIELKNYDVAISNGKNVIDNLVLSAHYRIFKINLPESHYIQLKKLRRS